MIVECLPATPGATAAEQRLTPLPGTGYAPEMYMGPGRDYMCAPMGSGHGHPTGGGAPPNVQRSREDFRELALGHNVDFAKMAEMGPEVRRLLDMGSQIDQILDITNMPPAGRRPSGYAEPTGPITAQSYGRPPPPPAYGVPMGRCSAEACPRDPRSYVEQEPRMGGRPSYEGPNYARRPCSRETTIYVGENRPAKRSMSRASDLLERIRRDIDEHCAENILEKGHAGAGSIDDGEHDVRIHPRRNSLPHDSRPPSRNVRRASYDDGGRSDRRTPSKPRRQRSRRLKKSSSSSSSVDRPCSRRSKRSKDSKSKKTRRRSRKSSSSSSSSSSGSRSKSKPKGRSIEFGRKVTERLSSSSTGPEMEFGETPQRQQCQGMARSDMPPPQQQHLQKISPSNTQHHYLKIALSDTPDQPVVRSASPIRGTNRSAEKGIGTTQSKTAGGTLCKYGVQKEPIEDEEAPQGPQVPQVAPSGGPVYRYESYPSVHPH
ncbi:hypothetical protein HPB48_021093 [Haemaphysalis longicornis]|uniref:Uncharacterized protein n=1 Tax=Haemaphysalis longicornis TaxID=44386 RepID=A0A9J6FTB0_HAELO|nr:hypothetical protein HPB48_021093 [Haemaphysalis longicornis]